MLPFVVSNKKPAAWVLVLSLVVTTLLLPIPQIGAADHGDAPAASADRRTDLGDTYAFLDPNDNSRVVIAMTVQGFIVPAEAVNFGIFDPNIGYLFDLETTGDARPDHVIEVTFTEKINSAATPQTSYIGSSFFPTFSASTTVPNLAATGPNPVVTTDAGTGISYFAGVVDDPFFFDIPAFSRFVGSVLAGAPNVSHFNRGRDSFAGYNTLAIVLSIPVALLQRNMPVGANVLGVSARTGRRMPSFRTPSRFRPTYEQVDRSGVPTVNTALIPFPRKDEYNQASPVADARGRFAADIVGTLTRLGTNATNIGILASVAVTRGDYLRLNLTTPNTGPGGGNNAGGGFPNGRRLSDDVIDTVLFFVANQNPLGDNVNGNDVPFRDQFPYFGAAHQPRDSGVDDNTRN
jgi:hypothetical protein